MMDKFRRMEIGACRFGVVASRTQHRVPPHLLELHIFGVGSIFCNILVYNLDH